MRGAGERALMDVLRRLLGSATKPRKESGKKARRTRSDKRRAAPERSSPRQEMTAAEVVKEALIRG